MQKDDFLKLFLASLQNQDPLSPMETADMMEQMTQLTLIEQITNMSKVVDKLAETFSSVGDKDASNNLEKAVNFIGKNIGGFSSTGELIEGEVTGVLVSEGKTSVIVDKQNVDLGNITSVGNVASLYKQYQ